MEKIIPITLMTMITQSDRERIKLDFENIFKSLNSLTWTTKTLCSCFDAYGIPNPKCELCSGTGYTETTNTIDADIEVLKGDERVIIEAGMLKAGDIIIRTSIDNKIKVGDKLTHNSQDYEVKFVSPDQLEVYYEVGGHKIA